MNHHRLLERQLRKLGLDPEQPPTDLASWRALLQSIGGSYETADQDRYTLERSLRLSSDEMRILNDRLQERYNEMERRFFQAQRLESIGRLAGGVAHDFNNILGVIMSCAEMVKMQLGKGVAEEDIEEVLRAAHRGAELTRQLLAFSRREVVRPEVIDLDDAIRKVERMLHTTVGERVQLEIVRKAREATVEIDPTQAEQVLVNLAVNARDAMPQGGVLRYTTSERTIEDPRAGPHPDITPGTWIVLTVEDEGVGMPAEVLDRVFEPFFTTKERGKGTGMGLATVYGIVRQAGGHILVDSVLGEGTRFRIYLPKRSRSDHVAATRQPEAPAKPNGAGRTVLVLEDEPPLLKILVRVLQGAGFRVLQASNAEVALEAAAGSEQPIDLILSDIVMPGRSGPEIVEHLKEHGISPNVLYMSGYPEDAIDKHGVLQEGMRLIHKPFDNLTLLRAIEEALAPATRRAS